MHRGLLFNIQRFAVHDGPGIRTTVFLKGCPLRCAWCHNPEGISRQREILVSSSRCLACRACREVCPEADSSTGLGPLPIANARCICCGACVAACPTEARQLAGRELRVPDLLQQVLKDRVFYESSGGGVTFSGGEPLSQPEFLREALIACRAAGLHTAVDTCGLAPLEDLLAVAPFTNLFLYDLKSMDSAKHREHTGAPNEPILANLEALSEVHSCIWVRIPLIPGMNDDPEELAAAARLIRRIPAVRQINVLPFHRNGLHKAAAHGRADQFATLEPPSPASLTQAAAVLRESGVLVKTGG
jgi:pyruvate formate lyase activating enzyme